MSSTTSHPGRCLTQTNRFKMSSYPQTSNMSRFCCKKTLKLKHFTKWNLCIVIFIIGFLHWIPYSLAVDDNDCWNDPCENEGVCIDGFQNFTCDCPILYNGTTCQNYIGDLGCAILPCQNNATCMQRTPVNSNTLPFICSCIPGFTGTFCETNMNECQQTTLPCRNEGQCVDGINTYTCNCSGTGYEGEMCDNDADECTTFDCGPGGNCLNSPGGFTCNCPEGYTGTPCVRVSPCNSQPCLNNGVCGDDGSTYNCACSLGYTGVNCETLIDYCSNVTCAGEHVICENGLTSYRCICEPGFIGSPGNCTDFDECSTFPCQNGGTCLNLVNDYRCDCVPGFNGTNCEITFNNCASQPCLNGGSCFDSLDDFRCVCKDGFTGKNCGTDIDDCLGKPDACENGGTCRDQIGGNTCDCPPGYSGFRCETDINECDSRPCLNNATCINLINNYTCECLTGFTGRNCGENINDCVPEPCENNGLCQDGINNYTCNCTSEWMGFNCQQEYDACSFMPCLNGATCLSTPRDRDYTCECVLGFTGANCETNIDNCVSHDCKWYQQCFDGINTYTCNCPTGFSGPNCTVNQDECSSSPCKNNATCRDGLDTYTCECDVTLVNLTRYMPGQEPFVFQTGFKGENCEEDINECQISPSVCRNSATCQNSNGTYTCFCGNKQIAGSSQRIYYTGTNCEIVTNYCEVAEEARFDPPACWNKGTCRGGDGKFTCECAPGFNGTRCKHNIQECDVIRETENREPCGYNGTCIDQINGFSCDCIPGISGPNCTVNIKECNEKPCQNGGVCSDEINDYTCNCQGTGFTGKNCTENIDDCENDPCRNGAECIDLVKDYNCSCFPGFVGKNCEVDVDECISEPCQNGGTCFERSKESNFPNSPIPGNFSYPMAGGYFCICAPGFNGSSCENDIDECLLTEEPCLNGGTCNDGANSYTCDCASGFQGNRCQTEIDECLLYQPCRNGATCHDLVDDYKCQCLPSLNRIVYGGKNCSIELTGCQSIPCQNEAMCLPEYDESTEVHSYRCNCSPGWSGPTCTVDTSASFFGHSFIYQQGSTNNISLGMKTTVPDGVVAVIGSEPQNFISLELVAGKACIFTPGQQEQCLSPSLSNGKAHRLSLELLDTSLNFQIDDNELCATSVCSTSVSFSNKPADVTFGGVGQFIEILPETLSKKDFIGCTQDLTVNSNPVLISGVSLSQMSNVTSGCSRVPQCSPQSCQNRGKCQDMWFTPKCLCNRPFYGPSCDQEIPPVTFSPGLTESSVSYDLDPQSPRAEKLKLELSLSFFFTTRNQDGVLFFMGGNVFSDFNSCNQACNFFQIQLISGRVCLNYKVCISQSQQCSPPGILYNDGRSHLVEIDRNGKELSFLVDGILMFKTTFQNAGVFCEVYSNYLYFGNLPDVGSQRKRRQTQNPVIYNEHATNFKGVLQDVRLNNNLLLVHPLAQSDPDLPELFPFPNGANTTEEGIINDDICLLNTPCLNNATCSNVDFNDYSCSCPEGFSGKRCELMDYCLQSPCPQGATCSNIHQGFECAIPATFNGQSSLRYRGSKGINSSINSVSLRFRTRDMSSVLLSLPGRNGEFFQLEIANGLIQVVYNLGGGDQNVTGNEAVSDGQWHELRVEQFTSNILLHVDGVTKMAEYNSVNSLGDLIAATASSDSETNNLTVGSHFDNSNAFKGCLSDIRLGDILLPFYSDRVLQIPDNNNASQRFTLVSPGEITYNCSSDPVCDGITSPVCQNGGTCSDLWNKYECECVLGWEGNQCQTNIDDCVDHECLNGGSCTDALNDYNCTCVPGFYGWRCEAEINECQSFPCLNDGICSDLIDDFSCNCTANYTGRTCDVLITQTCQDEPCLNGATCTDFNETISGLEVARYNCSCAPGYEGNNCQDEIDYCAGFPCQYGATCKSNVTLLDYICICAPGYTDKNCSTDIDECESYPCQNGATCNDLVNDFNCTCSSGWEGSDCSVDILECNNTVNPCGDKGRCIELPGSFDCDCDIGYEGKPCEDINECLQGVCLNGASCENSDGSYACNCSLGYEGVNCSRGNCSYGQCLEGSTCSIDPNTNKWSCQCQDFYEGERCDIRGPCADYPCENGATCSQNITLMSYTCTCPPGFEGQNCGEDIDECLDFPCENNGTCNNTIGSYGCDCIAGFTGKNCEIDIDDCAEVPCENGGSCTDLVNGFRCDCEQTGYEGPTCSEDIDECIISAPCQHGSTCNNIPGDFECNCAEGYEGDLCEIARTVEDNSNLIAIIVGSIVGFIVLVAIICLIVFIVLAANKRATRGTYSPSRQEMSGSRVELGQVIKPPPEERLI